MHVIIDNGHGVDTKGKRSPDNQLREYAWARDVAQKLKCKLEAAGVKCTMLVPEEEDISLKKRCARANAITAEHGVANCVLVSIHCNAAGADNQWHTAGGWSAYTSRGTTNADKLATMLYDAAQEHLRDYSAQMEAGKLAGKYDTKQRAFRTDYTDGDVDQEAGFYILQHTRCAAVLTENLFQDNRGDVLYLLSAKGKDNIVNLHYDGIMRYINSMEG